MNSSAQAALAAATISSREGAVHAISDVLRNGAIEEEHILQHQRHLLAQGGKRHIAHIVSTDGDRALFHVIKPLHQRNDGGLAHARGADQRDHFAGSGLKAHIVEHRLARVISEAHMAKFHAAIRAADFDRAGLFHDLALRVEDFEHAHRARERNLHILHQARERGQRLIKQ